MLHNRGIGLFLRGEDHNVTLPRLVSSGKLFLQILIDLLRVIMLYPRQCMTCKFSSCPIIAVIAISLAFQRHMYLKNLLIWLN
jgi:hypothetical protein